MILNFNYPKTLGQQYHSQNPCPQCVLSTLHIHPPHLLRVQMHAVWSLKPNQVRYLVEVFHLPYIVFGGLDQFLDLPTSSQWEFQDPKMEVPTIYKAYIRG